MNSMDIIAARLTAVSKDKCPLLLEYRYGGNSSTSSTFLDFL